ncbi:hypothetical protein ACOMHN_025789 [Nucella lapillus]
MVPRGWCLIGVLLAATLRVQEGGEIESGLYKIGILSVGDVSLPPRWGVRWCGSAMLCGKPHTTLRTVTMETTLNRTLKVIQQESDLDLWILTTTADIELQPVIAYLLSSNLSFLDFSQQTLPETDADWCSLFVKFAYKASWDMGTERQRTVQYVLDVVEHARLKTLIIVYNQNTEAEVSQLSDRLSASGMMHVLHDTQSRYVGHEVKDGVKGVTRYWGLKSKVVDFRHYTDLVLWCSMSCVASFMQEITQDMEDDSHDISIQHMTRILVVHPFVQSNSSCIFSNQSNPVVNNHSAAVNGTRMDQSRCQSREPEKVLSFVRQFYHVALLSKTEDCVLLQTMMMTKTGSRFLANAGFSYHQSHMTMTSEVFPNTKWRLNGQKFVVATAVWDPFVKVKKVGGGEVYSGLCIDMLMALAHSLNFTYELRQPPDGQYGSIENGNWTGLVRMLKDKKAQLVVAPIAVNELRATVVEFSTPYYHDYTGVLFRRPDPALHKWKAYFMPFSWQVLVMIGVSFVASTVFGHVVGVCCVPWVFQAPRPNVCLMDTVQYFFGSLLAQGHTGGVWRPTTGSARIFVSAWWLFCVVMAAIYSGNLTASFAVNTYDPAFTTLEGMLQRNTYDFGTVPGTIWIDIFKFSNRSDFKHIEKKVLQFTQRHAHEKINETEDHVQRTLRTNYAYVSNMASLSLTLAQHCNLMILEETFLPLQYAIALQKGSPLTDTVSRWILQMNEGGLDDLWASHWWTTPEQQCGVGSKREVMTVRLEDCQSAFHVLFLGIGAGLVAILAETLFHWLIRRKRRAGQRESTFRGRDGCGQDVCGSFHGECLNQNGISREGEHDHRENGEGLHSRRVCSNSVHRTLTSQQLCGEETELRLS